jgi:hypothetical protein
MQRPFDYASRLLGRWSLKSKGEERKLPQFGLMGTISRKTEIFYGRNIIFGHRREELE